MAGGIVHLRRPAIIAEPALWPEPPTLAKGSIDIGDVT
jgi:hypothetical protein